MALPGPTIARGNPPSSDHQIDQNLLAEWMSEVDQILASIDTTLTPTEMLIPSQYPSVQEALDQIPVFKRRGDALITVKIEAGHAFDGSELLLRGDLSGVLLSSEDAVVPLPVGFPADDYLVRSDGATGLVWDIKVDMGGGGRGGFYQPRGGDSLVVTRTAGVVNAGDNGQDDPGEDDDPRGFGIFVAGRVHCLWDDDTSEGADFSGAALRGIWGTYAGVMSGKFVKVQNCGSLPDFDLGHAGVFLSRNFLFHIDNLNADGSVTPIRNGRCHASARDGDFTNAMRHAITSFEGGTTTASRIDVSGSGEAGHAVIVSGSPNPNRPQGGGRIIVESMTANNIGGDLAVVYATDGVINIDDSTGGNLLGHVAICSGGLISLFQGVFSADPLSTAEQLIQSSNFGDVRGLGVVLDGGGAVEHYVRVSDGGRAYFRNATFSNATGAPFAFGDGLGEIYLSNMTINGTAGLFEGGVVLGPQAHFTKMSDAEFAVQNGFVLPDGNVFFVKDQVFEFAAGASDWSGLPGVRAGRATLDAFGARGDGSSDPAKMADELAALDRAAAWAKATGGQLYGRAGATYRIASTWNIGQINLDLCGADIVTGADVSVVEATAERYDESTLSADYTTGGTTIAVTGLTAAPAPGTPIKIVAPSSVDPGNRDQNGVNPYPLGEWVTVGIGSTTTQIVLAHPLLFSEGAGGEAYTVANGARVYVMDPTESVNIRNGRVYQDGSTDGSAVVLRGMCNNEIAVDVPFSAGVGVSLIGTYKSRVTGRIAAGVYGVADRGSYQNDIHVHAVPATAAARHGFTTLSNTTGSTFATRIGFGRTQSSIVHGWAEGWDVEAAWDTHHDANDITFADVQAVGGDSWGIAARGRRVVYQSPRLIGGTGKGINAFTEADTDDGAPWVKGTDVDDYTSVEVNSPYVERDNTPVFAKECTLRLAGRGHYRTNDHRVLWVQGAQVSIDGTHTFVANAGSGADNTGLIHIEATDGDSDMPPAKVTVHAGSVVDVDATALDATGVEVLNVEAGTSLVVRGLIRANVPAGTVWKVGGGDFVIEGQGRVEVLEDGVVVAVYQAAPVFVEDFGDTGTADDSALAINRAIQFVSNNGGGEVNFQGGKTYLIDTSIQLRPGVTCWGHGAIIKRRDNAGVFDMTTLAEEGSTYRFFDLTIDGNRQNQADPSASQNVIDANSAATSGAGGEEPNSADFFMSRCRVINYSYKGMGILVGGFRRVTIENCFIDDGGDPELFNAIYLRRVAAANVSNNRFGDNILGANIKIMSIGRGDRAVVHGNTGTAGDRAVSLADVSDFAVTSNVWKRLSTISDVDGQGIIVLQDEDTNEELRGVISGNIMHNFSQSCLRIGNLTGATVSDNVFSDAPTLIEARDVRQVQFTGNHLAIKNLTNLVGDGAGGWLAEGAIDIKGYHFTNSSRTLVGNIVEDKNVRVASTLSPASAIAIHTDATGGDIRVHGGVKEIFQDWATLSQEDNAAMLKFDCVEAAFTPAYSAASGTFDAITYALQSGDYSLDRRNGIVDVWFHIATDSLTVGAASGEVRISLPFTASSDVGGRGYAAAINATSFSTNPTFGHVIGGTDYVVLKDRSGATANATNLIVSELSTGSNANNLQVHVRYRVA